MSAVIGQGIGVTHRPFAGEADLPAMWAMLEACQAVDQLASPETRQGLHEETLEPTGSWQRETELWESGGDRFPAGAIQAFAVLWVPPQTEIQDAYCWFFVHPDARTDDQFARIVAWAEDRGVALAGDEAVLTVSAGDDEPWKSDVIARAGFAVVRQFQRMRRALDETLPEIVVPDGYQVRPLQGAEETPAWVDLYNNAFADHWEFIPMTIEERQIEQARASYRPELDLVVVAPDGSLAGFCTGTVTDREDGGREAYFALIGTHSDHRRRGVARAVIGTGFAALQAQGLTEVFLGVDTASPTSATSVYTSLGFVPIRVATVYRRPINREPMRDSMPRER